MQRCRFLLIQNLEARLRSQLKKPAAKNQLPGVILELLLTKGRKTSSSPASGVKQKCARFPWTPVCLWQWLAILCRTWLLNWLLIITVQADVRIICPVPEIQIGQEARGQHGPLSDLKVLVDDEFSEWVFHCHQWLPAPWSYGLKDVLSILMFLFLCALCRE